MPCSCSVTRVRISSIDAILLFDLPQFPPRPQQNLQVRDVRRHLMYRKRVIGLDRVNRVNSGLESKLTVYMSVVVNVS